MSKLKLLILVLLGAILVSGPIFPVFAIEYSPGVAVGQYLKYGNFSGVGPGVEDFNNYDWLKLQVTDISGNTVTLLSTSQYKNGTAIVGNGSTAVWDIETGTDNGVPSTQGPIIAANLNQGDAIPPPNTYTVNRTENRVYLGVSRAVNILEATISAPDYNGTLTYVYDRASGMLLESTATTTTQAQPQPVTTTVSYSILETNIFGSIPNSPTPSPSPTLSPSIPEMPSQVMGFAMLMTFILVTCVLLFSKRKQNCRIDYSGP